MERVLKGVKFTSNIPAYTLDYTHIGKQTKQENNGMMRARFAEDGKVGGEK